MKKSINDLKRAVVMAETERESIEKQISSLEGKLREKNEEKEQCSDSKSYLACQDDLRQIEADLFIERKKLEKQRKPFTEADVREAWTDYATAYNKGMQSKMKDFQKALTAFIDAYKDMVDLQNDALKNRETCADLLGIERDSYKYGGDYDSAFTGFTRMTFIPQNANISHASILNKGPVQNGYSDECIYFMANEMIDADLLNNVVRLHKTTL